MLRIRVGCDAVPSPNCRRRHCLTQVDPTAEETKGGSGHVGKMLLSASDAQLALVAYVPANKTSPPRFVCVHAWKAGAREKVYR